MARVPVSFAALSDASGGYSGTPLAKKLGLKAGGRLTLLRAPAGWSAGELPAGASEKVARSSPARLAPGGAGGGDEVTVFFARRRLELARSIEPLARRVHPDGALWIAWPRRAGGHESDIREQDIRDLALPRGLVDNKVAALDEDWSALRLVWRLEHRDS